MFGYFGIIGHSGWLDNVYFDIPDGIKQLLHVLTAVNMQKKPFLTFWTDAAGVPLDFSWFWITETQVVMHQLKNLMIINKFLNWCTTTWSMLKIRI